MVDNVSVKYNADSLRKLVGQQLKDMKKYDFKLLSRAIENRLDMEEENLPKGFSGLFKFNTPILHGNLLPYIYEDKFGRGAAPTDTYFVQSNNKISAIIKIIGQASCIGPIDEVPEHIHVFSMEELKDKVAEVIKMFEDEIARLEAEEKKKSEEENLD